MGGLTRPGELRARAGDMGLEEHCGRAQLVGRLPKLRPSEYIITRHLHHESRHVFESGAHAKSIAFQNALLRQVSAV